MWERLDEGDPVGESTNLKVMAIKEAELVLIESQIPETLKYNLWGLMVD